MLLSCGLIFFRTRTFIAFLKICLCLSPCLTHLRLVYPPLSNGSKLNLFSSLFVLYSVFTLTSSGLISPVLTKLCRFISRFILRIRIDCTSYIWRVIKFYLLQLQSHIHLVSLKFVSFMPTQFSFIDLLVSKNGLT